MNDIERRFIPFKDAEIRANKETGKPVIMGYSAVFDTWGSELYGFKEKIAPGAFSDSIKNDDIRALFNHDPNWVLGRNIANTLRLKEDSHGLYIEIDVNENDINATSIFAKIERGDVSGQSFGFITKEDEWFYPENGMPERTLKKVQLFDVSPVTYPFYESTDVSVALRSLDLNKPVISGDTAGDKNEIGQGFDIENKRKRLRIIELNQS